MSANNRIRLTMLVVLLGVIPVGLWTRSRLPVPWLANASGAVLYELAAMALLLALTPRARLGVIAGLVFLGTCALELAQLSDAGWLVDIRATTPGRLLLGGNGGFDWNDFPLYALGCIIGYALYPKPKPKPADENRSLHPGHRLPPSPPSG